MSLSRHFMREEFTCRCGCGFDTVDVELLQLLQRLRDHFMCQLLLTSEGGGARCVDYNRRVGGAEHSQHLVGKAADFVIIGVPAATVQALLRDWYPIQFGIGHGKTFTHVDVRGKKADWYY